MKAHEHPVLEAWIRRVAELCRPDAIEWCDGSPAEYQRMVQKLVASGAAQRLSPELHPNSIAV
ncbi:MAG TPA: hypothetical protein DCY89_02635, partial [Gammaproteobacteria bacterium]|nr:hypothetical protein [Gammaproteobacteria bacterium]